MPEGKFTEQAKRINGQSKKTLTLKGAKKFSKADADDLVKFLNVCKDLPIVAHNVDYDRDQVLKPAFNKICNKKLPLDNRWVCTKKMSYELTDLKGHSLDDVLEYFDFESRCPKTKHDSVTDCHYAAKIYMKMMEKPNEKKEQLGFMHKYVSKK